ncbi:MAG: transporter permease [Clostridiales bacterium]|jgi:ABC-2 type transport system permease protein|nr:transporter permease [Clostridiales bacterium]
MFIHAFKYRIKILFNNKALLFWTLLFPIILGTLFQLALSGITESEFFKVINIAVVNNDEYNNDLAFKNSLASVSDESSEDRMFNVTLTSTEEAVTLLEDDKIDAYILLNNGINLTVKNSGMNQTIVKSFLDTYSQTNSAVINIISSNPDSQNEIMNSLSMSTTHTKAKENTSTNILLHYFYTLIAMACLYAANWGSKEVCDIQANISPTAARLNMVPIHKLKIFLTNICASFCIAFAEILIVIAYLTFVIKIDFGDKIGFVILTAFIGCIVGITFGALISSLSNASKEGKTSLIMSLTMLQCFLAGMMIVQIKYYIKTTVPILSYINPANLLTDAFYYLYNYSTFNAYFTTIGILTGFIFIFVLISYLKLRRQKYASL